MDYKKFVNNMCKFFNKQTLEYLYNFDKVKFIVENGKITNYEIEEQDMYEIKRKGKLYCVIDSETGENVANCDTYEDAKYEKYILEEKGGSYV